MVFFSSINALTTSECLWKKVARRTMDRKVHGYTLSTSSVAQWQWGRNAVATWSFDNIIALRTFIINILISRSSFRTSSSVRWFVRGQCAQKQAASINVHEQLCAGRTNRKGEREREKERKRDAATSLRTVLDSIA